MRLGFLLGSAFGWVVAIFAGFWLFLAARGIAHDYKRGGEETDRRNNRSFRSRWCWGILRAALSAMGLLKLPTSFE